MQLQNTYMPFWPLYLLLSIVTRCALTNPVSSPDITSKSNKVESQQQSTLKDNSQDPLLNSLSAYASAGYNGISDIAFKPSYKLPNMETNFTPIQTTAVGGSSANSIASSVQSPSPVLMQYFRPQTVSEDGVQYLQLIPSPLLVPISSYMPGQASLPFHQSLSVENSNGDFIDRNPPMLHAGNAVAALPAPTLVNVPSHHLPYGLSTYANSIQPYRPAYRFNREVKEKRLDSGLNLNLNEYLPGPHDSSNHSLLRGRP